MLVPSKLTRGETKVDYKSKQSKLDRKLRVDVPQPHIQAPRIALASPKVSPSSPEEELNEESEFQVSFKDPEIRIASVRFLARCYRSLSLSFLHPHQHISVTWSTSSC